MFHAVLHRHRGEILRALANHHYEVAPNGFLLLPGIGAIGGSFEHEVIRNGERLGAVAIDGNAVCVEGLNYLLDVGLRDQAKIGTWYASLFSNNVTPSSALLAADYDTTCAEITAYDEATRPAYVPAAAASGVMNNSAAKAQFTINGTVSNWGAALLSDSAKESAVVGQKLFAAVKYAAVRNLVAADLLNLQYSVTLAST